MDGYSYILTQGDLQFLRRILTNVAIPNLTLGDDADDPVIVQAADNCRRLDTVLSEIADGLCHDDAIRARDGVTDIVHGVAR